MSLINFKKDTNNNNNSNIANFNENFKKFRKDAGLSQVELAARMGITPQAVSKWEAGLSFPDITLLLPLSELFGITVDELLCGDGTPAVKESKSNVTVGLPDDGVLRVVKCIGNRIISADEIPAYGEKVNVTVNAKDFGNVEFQNIEVRCGDLVIERGNVSCEDIYGNVTVEDGGISCGNIGGNVTAEDGDISCGNIGGIVTVKGGDISCEDISGDAVTSGGNISCSDIGGNAATSGGDINCNNIGGNAIVGGGDITCSNIGGNIQY